VFRISSALLFLSLVISSKAGADPYTWKQEEGEEGGGDPIGEHLLGVIIAAISQIRRLMTSSLVVNP